MRRIIINEHLTLDGVIQGPGGPEEDTSNGFELGGWTAKYGDDISGKSMMEAMQEDYDLLLGRVTFDIWENYWPHQSGFVGDKFNRIKKYVASQTRTESNWEGTSFLNGDTIEQVKALKASDGIDLHMWGSADFIQSLLREGLVDQMNLWTYPVILGKGKKLFADGAIPGSFKLIKHTVASTGMICASYQANGEVLIGQQEAN